MFGKAIIKSSSKKVLTLPKTAVLTKGAKHYVFKPISKDEFEPVLVEARRVSATKYEIEEGLNAGDEVIDNALFLLDSDAITNNLYDSEDNDW
jgi:Cu(I)/Ag(I) efflux system membrane fusion protein